MARSCSFSQFGLLFSSNCIVLFRLWISPLRLLGPAHTTPVGNGPHGPSLGPPPKHTVPLGVDLARPVFFKSGPLGTLCV